MKRDMIKILIDITLLIVVILLYVPVSNKLNTINAYADEISNTNLSINNDSSLKKLTIDGDNYTLYLMINKDNTTIDIDNLNIVINSNNYHVNDLYTNEDDTYIYYKLYNGSDKEINYDIYLDDNKKGNLSYNFSVM